MCLLRVELGVLTNGRLGTVEMVSEYIKHEQAEEVNTTNNSLRSKHFPGAKSEECQKPCSSLFAPWKCLLRRLTLQGNISLKVAGES